MIRDYLAKHSARDQLVIIIGFVFVSVWALYLFILDPLLTLKAQNQDDLAANKELLVWMKQSASEIKASGGGQATRVQGAGSSAVVVVEQALKQSGLNAPSRIEPSGSNKAIVQYDIVEFNKLLSAFDRLKNTYGIVVDNIKIGDLEADGMVKANINFIRKT